MFRRDMCGLAEELDDSYYSYLDGDDGWDRLREVFHDCAIAKWVDNGNLDSAYDFGDLISPTESFGLFKKINDDTLGCWELAVPPTFHVGAVSDTAWGYVPGNASDPDDPYCNGWNDPAEESNAFCGNSYCDSVTVRFWGSDYIAFIADTTYYNAGEDDAYLRIELDWGAGAMDDSTELWVSLLKYGCAPDSLFLCGSKLEHVTTGQFDSSDAGLAINVYDFHEGGTEAVAVVLSLVQKYEDLNRTNCSPSFHPQSCLTRHISAPRDLDYSYAFRVLRETSGGGCPFVEVRSGEHYVADNNVLAGCVGSEDEVDTYLLSAPQADDEEIGLRISENERQRSYFNRVALLAVDAPPDCEVGVLDGTAITAYRDKILPVAALDSEGHDCLAAIS
ncbi:MAG: hypothetical protein U9Q95_01180, partial [Candidatus Eisenbacteria bacterium]|nr:hypothetical protein [Candidatus Eisenbacteria bacterium]